MTGRMGAHLVVCLRRRSERQHCFVADLRLPILIVAFDGRVCCCVI